MTTSNSNHGLLICGACAISADPKSNAPSSVEKLGMAMKKVFARKLPPQSTEHRYASPLQKAS